MDPKRPEAVLPEEPPPEPPPPLRAMPAAEVYAPAGVRWEAATAVVAVAASSGIAQLAGLADVRRLSASDAALLVAVAVAFAGFIYLLARGRLRKSMRRAVSLPAGVDVTSRLGSASARTSYLAYTLVRFVVIPLAGTAAFEFVAGEARSVFAAFTVMVVATVAGTSTITAYIRTYERRHGVMLVSEHVDEREGGSGRLFTIGG